MSELAGVQGDFQDYLLRGSLAIEAHVVGTARVPLATRLGVYGGAYAPASPRRCRRTSRRSLSCWTRRTSAPSRRITWARIDSSFFSIRYDGHELPQFLGTHPDYRDAPVLAELARWEWTMTGAFDAADATPLTHAALAGFSPQQWAQLRFSWHPSVARLGLGWNVPQLWQALTADTGRPAASVNREPVQWLLWRQELTTYFRSLSATEAQALDAARDGWPFGELSRCCVMSWARRRRRCRRRHLLRGWIDAGLIIGAA